MDSYFGEIGHSFYGGPNGQSFSIKKEFPNKIALNNDLELRFASSVQIGEYVTIFYGNPHGTPSVPETVNYNSYSNFPNPGVNGVLYRALDTGYIYCWGWVEQNSTWEEQYVLLNDGTQQRNQYFYNRSLDYYAYKGETYGSMLWQKNYIQEGNSSVFEYIPIATFETSSPDFVFTTNVQDPGEFNPNVNNIEDISISEIIKTFQLSMPNAWNITKGKIVQSNPSLSGDNLINVEINRYPNNDEQNESDTTKYIHFTLPKPWKIAITKGSDLAANASPSLEEVTSTSDTKNWILQLPKPWGFEIGEVISSDPGEEEPGPNVEIENNQSSSPTAKLLNFKLPKPWEIALGTDSKFVDPGNEQGGDEGPEISIDAYINGNKTGSGDTKTRYVHIKIPKAWDIDLGKVVQSDPGLSGNELINVEINRYPNNDEQDKSKTTKYIHFTLPKAWGFALGTVTSIGPTENPEVSVNNSEDKFDEEEATTLSNIQKYFHFKLPVAQVFDENSFALKNLGPTGESDIEISFDEEDRIQQYPKVTLSIPRAAITRYGKYIAYTNDATINVNSSDDSDWGAIKDLDVGDFYINTSYAAVHRIKFKTSSQATTEYCGSMQLAIPKITSTGIDPYKDTNGTINDPTIEIVSSSYPVTSWELKMGIPAAPTISLSQNSRFIPSTETGKISMSRSTTGVTYEFQIPKGTKITVGSSSDMAKQDLKVDGDLFLRTDEGYQGSLYVYSKSDVQSEGTWKYSTSLKGKNGSNFTIKNSSPINIRYIDIGSSTYQAMGEYIDTHYSDYADLKENEVLNVSFQTETDDIQSHWLFKVKSNNTDEMIWNGSKLTGDIGNSIISTNWTEDTDSGVYSITLINSLRQTISVLSEQVAALWTDYIRGWGTLPIE